MFFDPPDFSPLVQVETPRSAEILLAIRRREIRASRLAAIS